jgi:hypothetical protein
VSVSLFTTVLTLEEGLDFGIGGRLHDFDIFQAAFLPAVPH